MTESKKKVVPMNECVLGTVLHKRIGKIIELIPKGFQRREAVVNSLKVPQRLIRSTPPAAMEKRWVDVSCIIEREFPAPRVKAFERKIVRIFIATVNLTPVEKRLVD